MTSYNKSIELNEDMIRTELNNSQCDSESYLLLKKVNLKTILAIMTFIGVIIIIIMLLILNINLFKFKRETIENNTINKIDLPCLSLTCLKASLEISNSIDISKDPCIDFDQFACGNWKNSVPNGKAIFSTFKAIDIKLFKIQKHIMESQFSINHSSSLAKAQRLYSSCLDLKKLKLLGKTPLLNEIKQLYGEWDMLLINKFILKNWDFRRIVEDPYIKSPMFNLGVQENIKNSSKNIFYISLTSLLLDRKIFSNESTLKIEKIFKAYRNYMKEVGNLLGLNETKYEEFYNILKLEQEIAMINPKAEDTRDPDTKFNIMPLSKLQNDICRLFNWSEIIRKRLELVNLTLSSDMEISVPLPIYFKKICELFELYNNNLKKKLILHNYTIWKFIISKIKYLSEDFLQTQMNFNRIYRGIVGNEERWETCINIVQKNMGLVLGNIFIKHYFDKKSRLQAFKMINHLKEQFRKNLKRNNWMDKTSLEEAIEKINQMWPIVGYTEFNLNNTFIEKFFSEIDIKNDTFYDNIYLFDVHRLKGTFKRINNRPTPSSIHNPLDVNAYYNQNKNEIIFPIGILQNPFFEPDFPLSMNYGGIGSAMGHEITHGFDDSGSKFDSSGNLQPWWTNTTRNLFEEKSDCFIKQYSQYSVDGQYINGKNTLGENIADNGGLRLTYQVFKDLEKKYGVEKLLPGLNYTQDQLFFISFARSWCITQTKESLLLAVASNKHAPSNFRVKGVLSNLKEFSEAFKCPHGSPMNPLKKCVLW